MDAERVAGIALARTHGVGPITWRKLLSRYGTAEAALCAIPDLARSTQKAATILPRRADIEREIATVEALGAQYLLAGDTDYPLLLEEMPGAPSVLITMGDHGLLHRSAVAIVGARNASAAGRRLAGLLADGLGQHGLAIVSGLARGIDTAAHQGALAHGTIGVIASGHNIYFPPENRDLQQLLARDHLVVSEYPPGTEPLARQFPHRNRIIAGLAQATLVVEAAPKSGSLLTARMAADAGRDVMAVPGSPLDPRAQGCNQLIRDGATLIQTVDDVLELFAPTQIPRRVEHPVQHLPLRNTPEPSEPDRQALLGLLGPVAVSIDELARQSGIGIEQVQVMLLELEIGGRVSHHAGGKVSLTL